MALNYLIFKDGQQTGPYSDQQIQDSLRAGRFSAQDMCWNEEMPDWKPLHTFVEFRDNASSSPGSAPVGVTVTEKVKTASLDSVKAFKIFALDPVAGLADAFESLGQPRALGAGAMFGLVFALCILIAIYRVLPESARPDDIGGFLKFLTYCYVPFVSLSVASIVIRTICRGIGGVGYDSFASGASLLPIGFAILIASFLGLANIEVIVVLALFAFCLNILMLFAGCTRIALISERIATITVPLMLLACAWISKIIYSLIGLPESIAGWATTIPRGWFH